MKKLFTIILLFSALICSSRIETVETYTVTTVTTDIPIIKTVIKIKLNAGQIENVYTNPVIIIANTDITKRIKLLSISGDLQFSSSPYNTNLSIVFYNTLQDSTYPLYVINSVASKSLNAKQYSDIISWGDSMSIKVTGGNKEGGNCEMDLTVNYLLLSK